MRIDLIPFDRLFEWLHVNTEDEVLEWCNMHNVKIHFERFVNIIEFELAYDKSSIEENFIKHYGADWVKYYLPFMTSIKIDMKDTVKVKLISSVIKNIYEGKEAPIINEELDMEGFFSHKGRKKSNVTTLGWKAGAELLTKLYRALLDFGIIDSLSEDEFDVHFIELKHEGEVPLINWKEEKYYLTYFFDKLFDKGFLDEKFKNNKNERLANHFKINGQSTDATELSSARDYFKKEVFPKLIANDISIPKKQTHRNLNDIIKRLDSNRSKHS